MLVEIEDETLLKDGGVMINEMKISQKEVSRSETRHEVHIRLAGQQVQEEGAKVGGLDVPSGRYRVVIRNQSGMT